MNLLSRVTRGPWTASLNGPEEEVFGTAILAANDVTVAAISRSKDSERDDADAQLLAASYDHALTLAAIMAGKCYWSDQTNFDLDLIGISTRPGKMTECRIDAFGCPILTDELRGELERLVGIGGGE